MLALQQNNKKNKGRSSQMEEEEGHFLHETICALLGDNRTDQKMELFAVNNNINSEKLRHYLNNPQGMRNKEKKRMQRKLKRVVKRIFKQNHVEWKKAYKQKEYSYLNKDAFSMHIQGTQRKAYTPSMMPSKRRASPFKKSKLEKRHQSTQQGRGRGRRGREKQRKRRDEKIMYVHYSGKEQRPQTDPSGGHRPSPHSKMEGKTSPLCINDNIQLPVIDTEHARFSQHFPKKWSPTKRAPIQSPMKGSPSTAKPLGRKSSSPLMDLRIHGVVSSQNQRPISHYRETQKYFADVTKSIARPKSTKPKGTPTLKFPVLNEQSLQAKRKYREWTNVRLIGSGGYGKVYQGVLQSGQFIAVKCIPDVNDALTTPLTNVLKEVNHLHNLKHKNIIQVYGIYHNEAKKRYEIYLEYASEGSLRLFLTQIKGIAVRIKIMQSFLIQILKGLRYLHKSNVVHQDIKPDNILLDREKVKLADFGSARLSSAFLRGYSTQGTAEYMAPEAVRGDYNHLHCHAIDIWALGMTVYEMVTLERFWSMVPQRATLLWRIGSLKETPLVRPDKVPLDSLRHFIQSCIAIQPSDRPSAKDLLKHPFLREELAIPDSPSSSIHSQHYDEHDLMLLTSSTKTIGVIEFSDNDDF